MDFSYDEKKDGETTKDKSKMTREELRENRKRRRAKINLDCFDHSTCTE